MAPRAVGSGCDRRRGGRWLISLVVVSPLVLAFQAFLVLLTSS
ncbi:hypothetical protein ACFFRB_02950 [Kibdelosporangium aridum subsp. largum]